MLSLGPRPGISAWGCCVCFARFSGKAGGSEAGGGSCVHPQRGCTTRASRAFLSNLTFLRRDEENKNTHNNNNQALTYIYIYVYAHTCTGTSESGTGVRAWRATHRGQRQELARTGVGSCLLLSCLVFGAGVGPHGGASGGLARRAVCPKRQSRDGAHCHFAVLYYICGAYICICIYM